MAVQVQDVTIAALMKAARAAKIRRVLLTEYATVEPKKRGTALVLVGMITLVATAFDHQKRVIYRWSKEAESEQMVTISAGTGRGKSPGGQLTTKRESLFEVLREEGFEVDEGEWTPESAQAYLASRKELVG